MEAAYKKTGVQSQIPLMPLLGLVRTSKRRMGMSESIMSSLKKFKRFFGEMSVPTLINMFMQNTYHTVYNWYKELKQQELKWEQFLTEANVTNDKEARWDSLKRKGDNKVRQLPSSSNMAESVAWPERRSQ